MPEAPSHSLFEGEDPLQTIDFELSPLDLEEGQVSMVSTSPHVSAARRKSILVSSLTTGVIVFFLFRDKELLDRASFGIGGAILCLLFWLQYYRPANTKKLLRRDHAKLYRGGLGSEGMVGPRRLSLYPGGLRIETSATATEEHWGAISKLVVNENYLFIFSTPVTAHIVPKSCLGAPGFDSFVEKTREAARNAVVVERW